MNVSRVPFSFRELTSAPGVAEAPLERTKARDGVDLVYRAYVPREPRAVLVFYHGGGAHGGAGYQHIGAGLSKDYDVATVIPDIRGHGASGGARGDAPSTKQVLDDVDALIREVGRRHQGIPLFLGGHSSGAGLVLNYSSADETHRVAGYVFVAPELGFRSRTAREDRQPFAKVAAMAFIAHGLTGRLLFGHSKAVKFNYPGEILDSATGLIGYNTINMAIALTPISPDRQLRQLGRPLGVWIGELDELLDAGKVESFVKRACPEAYVERITGEKHLSILLKTTRHIGPWIAREAGGFGAE